MWWAHLDKRRPVIILTRDETVPLLNAVVVAPGTTTVRNIPSELRLGPDDGMTTDTAFAFDAIATVPKTGFEARICVLDPARRVEMCDAMRASLDC